VGPSKSAEDKKRSNGEVKPVSRELRETGGEPLVGETPVKPSLRGRRAATGERLVEVSGKPLTKVRSR